MDKINKKIVISSKIYKIYFYIFLVFIVLTIYLTNYSFKHLNKDISTIESLETVLTADSYNTNSYLDVEKTPILIASVNNQNTGYYLVNSGKFMYIVYMNNNQFNKLKEDLTSGNQRIYGVTAVPSDDFKKILVNDLNTSYSYSYTIDDYDTLVGQYDLDMIHYESHNYYNFIYPVLTLIISLLLFITYLHHRKATKKTLQNINKKELIKISAELLDKNCIKSNNTYLSANYLLNLGLNFSIDKIENAILLYQRDSGLSWDRSKELIVYTKQSKYIIRSSKGTDKDIELLAKRIVAHNKDVLIGYTDENIDILKAKRI